MNNESLRLWALILETNIIQERMAPTYYDKISVDINPHIKAFSVLPLPYFLWSYPTKLVNVGPQRLCFTGRGS